MQRKPPFRSCKRHSTPARLRAQIMLRQKGRCFDCETRMMLGKIVFDHRPPLALRAKGDNANDPDRLVAICTICDQRKKPRDIKEIARTKRLALNHQDFTDRMRDKVSGRPVPSKSQWQKLVRSIERPLGPILASATPLRASKPVSTKNNER
jgi:5-methylcytosine-specific restriction endonuclease McrA